jgi:aspartyl/glutamyl-tRNA(Asn/Gln) amidotransferase C subunit
MRYNSGMSKTVDASYLGKLANIPVSAAEAVTLSAQFSTTLKTIATLNELNTEGVEATPQVTSLENVFREDVVDPERLLSQESALSNAKATHQGYFMVKRILNESKSTDTLSDN